MIRTNQSRLTSGHIRQTKLLALLLFAFLTVPDVVQPARPRTDATLRNGLHADRHRVQKNASFEPFQVLLTFGRIQKRHLAKTRQQSVRRLFRRAIFEEGNVIDARVQDVLGNDGRGLVGGGGTAEIRSGRLERLELDRRGIQWQRASHSFFFSGRARFVLSFLAELREALERLLEHLDLGLVVVIVMDHMTFRRALRQFRRAQSFLAHLLLDEVVERGVLEALAKLLGTFRVFITSINTITAVKSITTEFPFGPALGQTDSPFGRFHLRRSSGLDVLSSIGLVGRYEHVVLQPAQNRILVELSYHLLAKGRQKFQVELVVREETVPEQFVGGGPHLRVHFHAVREEI